MAVIRVSVSGGLPPVAEQIPLLERPEHDATAALLLPDDVADLRAWINEAIERCEAEASLRTYPGAPSAEPAWRIWPHAWVLRDLVAALPEPGDHARLVAERESGRPVDARLVRALIEAVAALGFELRVSLGPLAPPEEEVTG